MPVAPGCLGPRRRGGGRLRLRRGPPLVRVARALCLGLLAAPQVIRSFPRRLDTASVKYEQVRGGGGRAFRSTLALGLHGRSCLRQDSANAQVRKLVFKLVESVRQQQQHAGAAGLLGVQVAGVGATADQPHTNQPALTSPVPALSPKLSNPQLARVQGQLVAGGELRHSSESRFSTSTDGGLVDASDLQGFVEQQHGQAHGGGGSAGGVSKPHDTLDDLDDVLGELDRELGGGAGELAARAPVWGLGCLFAVAPQADQRLILGGASLLYAHVCCRRGRGRRRSPAGLVRGSGGGRAKAARQRRPAGGAGAHVVVGHAAAPAVTAVQLRQQQHRRRRRRRRKQARRRAAGRAVQARAARGAPTQAASWARHSGPRRPRAELAPALCPACRAD